MKSWLQKACTFSQSTPLFVLSAAVLTPATPKPYTVRYQVLWYSSSSWCTWPSLVAGQPLILGCEPSRQHSKYCDSTEDDGRAIERLGGNRELERREKQGSEVQILNQCNGCHRTRPAAQRPGRVAEPSQRDKQIQLISFSIQHNVITQGTLNPHQRRVAFGVPSLCPDKLGMLVSFTSVSSKLRSHILFGRNLRTMAPDIAKRPIVAVEQGEAAGAAFDAVNRTIDSMPRTTVFFPVPPSFWWRSA